MSQPTYWVALLAAVAIGTFVGFIPGVGATLVTALMLPFVLFLVEDPAIGIVLLAMVGALNNTLDSIPAVLVGLPGSETQVTYLEGHQLARRGHAAHTLGGIYAVSAVGGVLGAGALALLIPIIKPFILEFSYTEIAVLALFGVAMVALLSRGGMMKGTAAGLFGILLGTVGVDPLTGTARFTLGQIQLWEGLPIIATILGIFALPELVDLTMTRRSVAPQGTKISNRDVFAGARYGLSRWKMIIRQSLFGTFMGAIPGIGGSVIDWLAYAFGISLTKNKQRANFGHGSLDGVLFAESANNSKAGGQALPTMTLGIPGSTSWAIIVVAILAYGISPGPSMVDQHADITMLMVLTLALGNLIVAGLGLAATNWLARLTKIPYPTIGFMIMAMVFLAAFMDLTSWLAIPIVLVFGIAGLLMKRYRWPRPPLILGFILGPIIDENLQSALSIYGPLGVLTRPIAIVLFVLLIVTVFTLFRLMSRSVETGRGPTENDIEHVPSNPTTDASESSEAPSATAPGQGKAGEANGMEGRPRTTDPSLVSRLWREEHLGPLLVIAAAVSFVVASFDYSARARALPLAAGLAIIALAAGQLIQQILRKGGKSEQIMDLGMRSTGMEGARRAGLSIAGMLALFLFLAGLIGLKYAAIVLAALGPVLLLSGRLRWIGGAISGAVVALFSTILMEQLVAVVWPEPIIWTWLQGILF